MTCDSPIFKMQYVRYPLTLKKGNDILPAATVRNSGLLEEGSSIIYNSVWLG